MKITVKNVTDYAVVIGSVVFPVPSGGFAEVDDADAGVQEMMKQGVLARFNRPPPAPDRPPTTAAEVEERLNALTQQLTASQAAQSQVDSQQSQTLADEQEARGEADAVHSRDIAANSERLTSAEEQIQALSDKQERLSGEMGGIAVEKTAGGNLVADGALKHSDLWYSAHGYEIDGEFVGDIENGKYGQAGVRKAGIRPHTNYCKTDIFIDPARIYRFSAWLRCNTQNPKKNYFAWFQKNKKAPNLSEIKTDIPAGEWVYVTHSMLGEEFGDSIINVGFALLNVGGAENSVIEIQNYRFEDVTYEAGIAAAADAADAAEKAAQAAADAKMAAGNAGQTAQTAMLAAQAAQTGAAQAQSKAEAAQTAAESAKSTAASAESKAEAAKQTATTAQTAAVEAQQTAGAAQTAAAEAKRTAQTAQSTAESAAGQAQTAQQTATAAQQTAATAKQTAEAAQRTANTAKQSADAATNKAQTAQQTAQNAQQTAEAAKLAVQTLAGGMDTLRSGIQAATETAEAAKRAAETAQSGGGTATSGITSLIHPVTNAANRQVDTRTGNIQTTPSHVATDFIAVRGGQGYTVVGVVSIGDPRYAWYDTGKRFISGGSGSISGFKFGLTAPANAAYVRISGGVNNNLGAMFLYQNPNT